MFIQAKPDDFDLRRYFNRMKKFDTGDDVVANPDTDTATLSDGSIALKNVVVLSGDEVVCYR